MNRNHHRGWATLVLLSASASLATAADLELALGRGEGWRAMTDRVWVATEPGRWGSPDLVLRDAAYEAEPATELLLHFDELPVSDEAGRYTTLATGLEVTSATRVLGAASGAFLGPRQALTLKPRPGSLFWPDTPWGDFTIEFWLYPTTLGEGETVLAWSGQSLDGATVADQRLLATLERRRLTFRFEGLFPGAADVVIAGSSQLLPRQWHHHLLRFDSRYGLLEYLVDGRPEAVTYATDTRREGGTLSTPRVAPGTPQLLVVAPNLAGMLDELRVSRSWIEEPALTRLDGSVGTAISRVFDLKLAGTTVRSIEAVYDHPSDTDVYFYLRMGDTLRGRGEIDSPWVPFRPGQAPPIARGRYLQLRLELLPDGRRWQSPSVSSLTVSYEPDLPPAPPRGLLAVAGDGEVKLSWPRVNESDVAGYRVYWGSRPGVYQEVIDAGNTTQLVVPGLENGRLYYFTVTTYDRADPTRRSAFVPDVAARPSGNRS